MKYPLYEIDWYDHYSGNANWTENPERGASLSKWLCHTVGYVIAEDKDQVALAQTLTEDGRHSHIMVIIKSTIKKKRKLKQQ